jgi:hypothetical protein
MSGLKPPDPSGPTLVSTIVAIQIRVYGASAVAIVQTTWRGSIEGKQIADSYVATYVWSHFGPRWRWVSAQVAQVEVER